MMLFDDEGVDDDDDGLQEALAEWLQDTNQHSRVAQYEIVKTSETVNELEVDCDVRRKLRKFRCMALSMR